MLKIAVFGFYSPDQRRTTSPRRDPHPSPVTTEAFMQHVWEMEPPAGRIGDSPDGPCFVKLTTVTRQPVYVQALGEQMAQGAGTLRADGYVIIIDAVKILAPRTIQSTLRRLADLQPEANVVMAAGRQNEPDALSCEDLRAMLNLHPDLPVMPYVLNEPKTVHRLIRRLVHYIDNPDRVPPPIFAGGHVVAKPELPTVEDRPPLDDAPVHTPPRIIGLDHVAVPVSDMARALAFYQGVLGLHLLGQIDLPEGHTLAHLDTGRGLLALMAHANGSAAPSGIPEIALRVSNLDALVDALAQAGAAILRQPTDMTWGVRVACVTDPDGTMIELTEGNAIYSRR